MFACTMDYNYVLLLVLLSLRLLPEQRVFQSGECCLAVERSTVEIEVTTFEPMQEVTITWEIQVSQVMVSCDIT